MNILNFIQKKSSWIICLLSFIAAFTYNEINLNKLAEKQIREGETVLTNDDYSYLNPAKNFINSGVWKANGLGNQAYFVRPPGYGFLYLALLKISSPPVTLFLLKLIQYLLFSVSVYWFYYITKELTKSKKVALVTSCIYGLTPFFIGFLSYTLTEGITPALVLLYIYLLFRAEKKTYSKQKVLLYLLASICFSYLLIVRPQLGFVGILLPIFIFKDYYKQSKLQLALYLILFCSVSFSLMFAWQIRNYKITNNYIGLHAIYQPDNNSIYRPTFNEFWNFVGCWAQEGHVAHSYMVPMWFAATKGDTSEVYIKNALATFPNRIINFYGEKRLFKVFKNYQLSILNQKKYLDKNIAMPISIPKLELEVVNDFKKLTKEYKREFWIDYHIISPLKVFKTMAFHSNLSLYIFQKTYRGNWFMEMVRLFFFGIHSLSFLSIIITFLMFRINDWRMTAINIFVVFYVVFLCYYQRGIEERYTLPILPLVFIGLVNLMHNIYLTSQLTLKKVNKKK